MTGTVPLCVLLAALAGPIVELVYGERWLPAAAALPWLMGLGLVRIGCELAYDCLVAIGHRRSLIGVQGLWLAVLVPVLVAGAGAGGIEGWPRATFWSRGPSWCRCSSSPCTGAVSGWAPWHAPAPGPSWPGP